MWNGFFMLLVLSSLMGISSFFAGSLPLSLSLSQRHIRYISALGTGVLVGTSLIVIIPEGIETLYTAYPPDEHSHSHRDLSHSLPLPHALDARSGSTKPKLNDRRDIAGAATNEARRARTVQKAAPNDDEGDDLAQVGRPASEEHPEAHQEGHEPHAWVGISLILGFILMYLIDVLPNILAAAPSRPLHISLSNLASGLHHSPSHSPTLYPADGAGPGAAAANANPPATTIGLVIHAAADGIALGASGSSSSTKLGLIVFIAIMIHKAPAAFGLTSVLLKQGLSKRHARAHLLIFSLAAPIGALGTWAAVNVLGSETLGGEEGMQFATGCVLLFSGGTFLYVAMHSMQETNAGQHAHPNHYGRSRSASTSSALANGYVESGLLDPNYGGHKSALSGVEITIVVAGMLVPLLTQVGHGGHGH